MFCNEAMVCRGFSASPVCTEHKAQKGGEVGAKTSGLLEGAMAFPGTLCLSTAQLAGSCFILGHRKCTREGAGGERAKA